jgi:death-on-curing protein
VSEPRWLDTASLLLLHSESIADHGGSDGVRDPGLLESALARPRNLLAYGTPDLAELAAAYAYGLARNHPFVDGNKRAALLAIGVFLGLNGHRLTASQPDAVLTMLALAAGDLDEADLAACIRANMAPLG